jgi:hypothetical protein
LTPFSIGVTIFFILHNTKLCIFISVTNVSILKIKVNLIKLRNDMIKITNIFRPSKDPKSWLSTQPKITEKTQMKFNL